MLITRLGSFIAAIACLPSVLLAQSDLDRMRQAFDQVPASAILEDDIGLSVSFHNPAAARDVNLGRFGPSGLEDALAFGRAAPQAMRERLSLYLSEGWKSRLGFDMSDVNTIASVAMPPLTSWRIELTRDMSEEISGVLVDRGYERKTTDGLTVFVRGEGDFHVDLKSRDPADPFGGHLGMASRVVLDGNVVYYSTSYSWLVAQFDGTEKPLTSHFAIDALLNGLSDVLPKDMRIIEVQVIGNPSVFDPGKPRNPQPNPDLPAPLGLWSLGMIVTLTDGTHEQLTAAFVMLNPDDAKRAAERIEAEWSGYRSLIADRTYVDIFRSPLKVAVSEADPRVISFSFANELATDITSIPLAISNHFMRALYVQDLPMFRAN